MVQVVAVKAALDLGADASHKDLRQQIVEVAEPLSLDPILALGANRPERVSQHDVHVGDGDRPVDHATAALNLPAHSSALVGSSNQYSSSRGMSSSSTTEYSHASSASLPV